MTKYYQSGIPGFDALIGEEGLGISADSVALIYGPPKVGKSIFCYQFMYNGLQQSEPCLYITADYGIKQLQQRTMDFNWFIQSHIQNQNLYIIDLISKLSGAKLEESANYKISSLQNPTDMMVKVGIGTRFLFQKSPQFRSILDSLTTQFAFNPEHLVLRVLKSYIERIKEANGVALITHTQGTVDHQTEEVLGDLVDFAVGMDGKNIYISSEDHSSEAKYEINDQGISIF
ncbi:MAG: RAD55 family ATPase [Methanobacteriaceae archaeon]|nr:RAD55 family ATPase [Methanobacteriaceae archaeon]